MVGAVTVAEFTSRRFAGGAAPVWFTGTTMRTRSPGAIRSMRNRGFVVDGDTSVTTEVPEPTVCDVNEPAV